MDFSSHLHETRGVRWGLIIYSEEAWHSIRVGHGAALFGEETG
jgi:hypothetical protein